MSDKDRNHEQLNRALMSNFNVFYKKKRGLLFFLTGKSGIGKTFAINSFLDKIKKNKDIEIFMKNCRFDTNYSFYPFYEIIFEKLKNKPIKENFKNVLRKAALSLPYLDKIIKPIIGEDDNRIIRNVLNLEKASDNEYPHLLLILDTFFKEKNIIIIENIQWLDNETIGFIDYLIDKIDEYKFLLIFTITNDAKILNSSRLNHLLLRLKKNCLKSVEYVNLINYSSDDFPKLLNNLLKKKI